MKPTPTQVPAQVMNLIRTRTNLAYLFNSTEALHIPLTSARRFHLFWNPTTRQHAGGGSIELLAGTKIWAFEHKKIGYSVYKRVGDEDWPAAGADRLYYGSDWTLIYVDGDEIGDAFVEGPKHNPGRVIGKV